MPGAYNLVAIALTVLGAWRASGTSNAGDKGVVVMDCGLWRWWRRRLSIRQDQPPHGRRQRFMGTPAYPSCRWLQDPAMAGQGRPP